MGDARESDVEEIPLHMMRSQRWLAAPVERIVNAALSRGPGYEPTPIGAAFDDRSVRGYYLDFSAKTRSETARDLTRLPSIPLIQLALGWWEVGLAEGANVVPDEFFSICAAIERRAQRTGDAWLWPINVRVAKYRLASRWCSALAQGQAASVFVRAYLSTREDRYAELARGAAQPLLTETGSDLVTHTASGPILEEVPSAPPAHILNGWISALWGLWDIGLGLDDARATGFFQRSLGALSALVPAYDTGRWTLYSLYPHVIADLAKPIYHRVHVDQLDVLHRLTGKPDFAETAARWRTYDTAVNRTRAIVQKGVFYASETRRRGTWEAHNR